MLSGKGHTGHKRVETICQMFKVRAIKNTPPLGFLVQSKVDLFCRQSEMPLKVNPKFLQSIIASVILLSGSLKKMVARIVILSD